MCCGFLSRVKTTRNGDMYVGMDEGDGSEFSCASKLHYLVICLGGDVCKVGREGNEKTFNKTMDTT